MRILTWEETAAWLKTHNFNQHSLTENVFEASDSLGFAVPEQSRSQAHLARFLPNAIGYHPTLLIWVQGWNIWPSEENMILLESLRQVTAGENRRLIDTPGHLFAREESDQCEALTRLGLAFGWDVSGFASGTNESFFFNHHGDGKLNLNSEARKNEIRINLDKITQSN